MPKVVYTIGYATKPVSTFIDQLKRYQVSALVDVRSVPFSKAFYDYHQPAIRSLLIQHKIHYIPMGEELGPRSKIPNHYDDKNQVQFDRLMQAPLFLKGIDRLFQGVEKGHSIALMCAEKHPLDCHRSLLIGYYLKRNSDIECRHILHNGDVIDQDALEQEMADMNEAKGDLFLSEEEVLESAWRCQCQKKNYIKPN